MVVLETIYKLHKDMGSIYARCGGDLYTWWGGGGGDTYLKIGDGGGGDLYLYTGDGEGSGGGGDL